MVILVLGRKLEAHQVRQAVSFEFLEYPSPMYFDCARAGAQPVRDGLGGQTDYE